MNEITSFNMLFVEAARAGLLLQQFHQAPDGRWRASWRRGSGPGATHYPTTEHERPFDAMLEALRSAFQTSISNAIHSLGTTAIKPTEDNIFA